MPVRQSEEELAAARRLESELEARQGKTDERATAAAAAAAAAKTGVLTRSPHAIAPST